eukprot:scaffold124766_cov16-Tisochrysis_lutea.AAC.2
MDNHADMIRTVTRRGCVAFLCKQFTIMLGCARSHLEGMRGFALQALDMYTKEGYSLTRLIGWQATVSK